MKNIFIPLLSAAIVLGGVFTKTSAFAGDKKETTEKPAKKKSTFFPFRGMIKSIDSKKGTISLPGAEGQPDRVFTLSNEVKLTLDGKKTNIKNISKKK